MEEQRTIISAFRINRTKMIDEASFKTVFWYHVKQYGIYETVNHMWILEENDLLGTLQKHIYSR